MKTTSLLVRPFTRRLLGLVCVIVPSLMCLVCEASLGPLDSWQVRRKVGSAKVVYGNGRFVVAANGPTHFLVSTNGIDWKAYLPPENGYFWSLDFANGNFLLLLTRYSYPNGGMALYSSVDGTSWVLRQFIPSNQNGSPISSVGGGNGMYVLATTGLSVSTDLVNWKQATVGATGLQEFAFGRGLIVGGPWLGCGLASTSDGLIWEYIPPPSNFAYNGVRFANGRFAAFAPGDTPAITVSPYADDWTTVVMPAYTNYTRLTSGNECFFLLSPNTNVFFSSEDALTWEPHSFGTNGAIVDIAFGGNTYVAVGDVILQSAPVTNVLAPAALAIRNVPGITISGPVGQTYQIEFTENLSDTNSFVALTNVVATSSPFLWLDVACTNSRPRFYRAMSLAR